MFCSIGPADSVRPAARLSELGYMFRIGLKQGWGNTGTLLLVLTWKKPSKMVRGKEEEIMPGGRREGERKAVWRCLASCGQSGELQRDLLCGISTPCFFFFLVSFAFFSAAANYTTYTHITHRLLFFPPSPIQRRQRWSTLRRKNKVLLFYKVDHWTDQIIISMKK